MGYTRDTDATIIDWIASRLQHRIPEEGTHMTDAKAIARESFRLIETGDAKLAQHIIAPDFINQEAEDDPEDVERQQHGPAGFLATSRWLRDAF